MVAALCSTLRLALLTLLGSCGAAVVWPGQVGGDAVPRRVSLRCATADDGGLCALDRRCIYFVTGNANKEREVNALVARLQLPFRVEHVDLDLPELQGDPDEICKAKVAAAAEHVGGSVLVEDTSLCFNALNGLPGPYIKWFVDAIGNHGLHRLLEGHHDKTAYARCILGFVEAPGKTPVLFTGRADGVIVEPSGEGGFGWDTCFLPEGHNVPFSAMTMDEKNQISHRARALTQFAEYCQANVEDIYLRMEG